ncbi:VWA domain-containing protein [Actinophytocola algeriensis]|uniref:VWA domain-containing protein n=1 Tax=Actinophytocola algeriensis TaxID=1768010 RepID=A0A7W7QF25_9PSEU|nr:VWA domain-containing protein [Actinophytocola algeriensis]MBB4912456.1 hypothetical protein [Actinophytocola algeriensis]MBE1480971.1 hypothetical protein [Actinophytocola algeriensis]
MDLERTWRTHWPDALRAWGPFINLHDPRMFASTANAEEAGLTGSFAAFSLFDRQVMIDLDAVVRLGLQDLPLEVLAHEVGHHVLCPADLADQGRLLARVRRGLPGLEQHAGMIQNMYADLLINDRLLRSRGLRMAEVYQRVRGSTDPLWTFYQRIFEILWALPGGTLAAGEVDAAMEGDAQLGAKLARVYATDWLGGAGGFAALCLRYLEQSVEEATERMRRLLCVGVLDADAHIPGLTSLDDGEILHPALDPKVNEYAAEPDPGKDSPPSGGQYRQPFDYGQLLRQLGLDISAQEAAARYYRERALPHLVRFPVRTTPLSTEPLPEGHGQWDVGEPVEAVDWLATTLRSPVVVPGVTTVQRIAGTVEGDRRDKQPVDLDIYVDSSGSIPNPARYESNLALAGAILALSALRVGARVQATLWSGTRQFTTTDGFVRDERAVLSIMTGYFGGATAFPLHVLRDTYRDRDRPTHIVVISDDGVDTMFTPADEHGTPGSRISSTALDAAGAGGTLLLLLRSERERERIAALAPGWDVRKVTSWHELVDFATAFSRRTYERSER